MKYSRFKLQFRVKALIMNDQSQDVSRVGDGIWSHGEETLQCLSPFVFVPRDTDAVSFDNN